MFQSATLKIGEGQNRVRAKIEYNCLLSKGVMSRSRATCLGPFSPDTLTKRAGHISSQDYNVSTVYNVHATLTLTREISFPGFYLSLKLLHLFHFTKCLVHFTDNGGNQRPF